MAFIDSNDLQRALRELNNGITFDLSVNRPSDYHPVMTGGPSRLEDVTGVYYLGRYIGPIGRGPLPESDEWETEIGFMPIPMSDAEKCDDGKVVYVEILKTDPFYNEALSKAERKDDNYTIDPDGRVFRYEAFKVGPVPKRIIKPGWRHTLSRILSAGIPNVTAGKLSAKLGVTLVP